MGTMRIRAIVTTVLLTIGSSASQSLGTPARAAPVQSTRLDIMLAPPITTAEAGSILKRLKLDRDDATVREIVAELQKKVERHIPSAELLANEIARALAASEEASRDVAAKATADAFHRRADLETAFTRAEEQFFDRLAQLPGVAEDDVERLRYERTLRRLSAAYALQPEAQVDLLAVLDRAIETGALDEAVLNAPDLADRLRAYRTARKSSEILRAADRVNLIETYLDIVQHGGDLGGPQYLSAVRGAGAAENAIIELNRRATLEIAPLIDARLHEMSAAAPVPAPVPAPAPVASPTEVQPADAPPAPTPPTAPTLATLQEIYADAAYSGAISRDPVGAVAAISAAAAIPEIPAELAATLTATAVRLSEALRPVIDRSRELIAESAHELAMSMRLTEAQALRDERQGQNAERITRLCLDALDASAAAFDNAAGEVAEEARTVLTSARAQLVQARHGVQTKLLHVPGGRIASEKLTSASAKGPRDGAAGGALK